MRLNVRTSGFPLVLGEESRDRTLKLLLEPRVTAEHEVYLLPSFVSIESLEPTGSSNPKIRDSCPSKDSPSLAKSLI